MAVNYTATINGKTYGFDFEDQRIDVDSSVDVLDVVDLYEAIKDAQNSIAGIVYDTIADAEGLASLSSGIKTYLTVSLRTAWEVNTLKTSGKFEVLGGNLIRADGADPFRDNSLITYIAFLSQAGILAETATSGLTPSESAQLAVIASVQTLVDELHKLQGLDAANPMTVTPTARTAGAITQAIAGDGETTTTVTRQ